MVSLRPFHTGDLPGLHRCMVELQDFERSIVPTYRHPGEKIADKYLTYLQDSCRKKDGVILVAEEGDAIAGFVCGWVESEDHICFRGFDRYWFVSDIVVLPEYRRRGIATDLLQATEAQARTRGVPLMKLAALAENTQAINAYHKAGYQEYEVALIKELSPPAAELMDNNYILSSPKTAS